MNYTYAASVLDYGADPTGTRDSTAAIQAACRENRHVYFPEGVYLVDRMTISGSVTLCGAGDHSTVIKTFNLTDDVMTFTSHGWHVRDMKFDAVANRRSGAYIHAGWTENREFTNATGDSAANFSTVENVALTRQYVGIDLDGCWSVNLSNLTAFDGTPDQEAAGGAIIRLGYTTYTGPVHIRGLTARTASPDLQPTCGIYMGHVDVVSISDTLLIYHKKDVYIAPRGRQFAALIEITNCCFDTAEYGLYIAPSDGARVLRCGVCNTWFGAHSAGGAVIDGSEGVVTGLQFTNCMFLANAGDGIRVEGKGVDGLYFSNSFSGGNLGNGLTLRKGAKNLIWTGGVLGACHEMKGNVQYGYETDGSCSGRVLLADLTGNTVGDAKDEGRSLQTFGNIGAQSQG